MLSAKELSRIRKTIIIISLAVLVIGIWNLAISFDSRLNLYYLDVGQGSSTLIHFANDYDILIDAGPDESVVSEIGKVLPFGDKEIELVFITHPHADHYNGLNFLISKYKIDKLFVGPAEIEGDEIYYQTLKTVAVSGGEVVKLKGLSDYRFENNRELSVIYLPEGDITAKDNSRVNNSSVIIKFTDGNNKFLFPGDAEAGEEGRLMDFKIDLKADVLMAGHHGSKTSSTEAFLKAVNPQLIVISVGKNNIYRHPNREVLDRYDLLNIPYSRTDVDGMIHLVSDGSVVQRK